MDKYIGIDVHSESCTIAVMNSAGRQLRQQVVDTQAKVLIEFLKGLAGDRYVCIEEGQLAEWLVETLGPYAKEMAVVQPKAHQGHKSDTADAWALAEQLRVRAKGVYVFKPTTQYRPLREAVRTYGIAVKDMTRAKNRFRSLLRARGIANLDKSIYEPKRRPAWIRKLPAPYRRRAQWLGEQIDSRVEAHGIAESWLKEEAKKCPEVQRLETVPGFGPVRAGQVVALVVTPHRFRTTRQFWKYCGLAIVTRASSEWKRDASRDGWQHVRGNVQTRGLNRNCCSQLKAVFKGAATTIIAKPNPLHEHFHQLVANGTKVHLARLTIARRIAAATLAIWKKKEDYDPTKHQSTNPA
jgi:transposase